MKDGFKYEKKMGIDDTATLGELNKRQWELNLNKDLFDEATEFTMDVPSNEET